MGTGRGTRLSDVLGAVDVGGEGSLGLRLRPIDCGVGGAVQHQIWCLRADLIADAGRVGHVQRRGVARDDARAAGSVRADQFATQ